MTTYLEAAQNTRSEKITLVTIEAVARVKLFTASGSDWTRSVDHFIVGVKDDGIVISDWTFTPETKMLTIIGGIDPKKRNLSVTYRMFFSNAAVILPYDLDSGVDVEWLPLVTDIGSIGQQLDNENTGIVLESTSTISMINSHGYFDDKFDTLIWENQEIKFFSWMPTIHISERAQLFEGVIESKSFSESKVNFKVKDFVFKLKNQVSLGTFTNADGIFLPSLLDTPKRRIYGQVDNVKCVSLDATLDGYILTGTLSLPIFSLTITGVGTKFLDEVSPEDEMFVVINEETYKIGIQSVDSDTQMTLARDIELSFSNEKIRLKPAVPWRKKNRSWHVAGHRLREPTANILLVQNSNTFLVDSVLDFFAGDELVINGFQTNVRRISGNKIVTNTNVIPNPVANDVIVKRSIKSAYFNTNKYVYDRDYLETNTTEAKITFNELAEFNTSEQKKLGTANFTFTNGSRVISTTATLDMRAILKSRDWIRSANAARTEWYEVLAVNENSITVRTPVTFVGGPYTESAFYKSVEVIDENGLVTIDCLGMEVDGKWIRTASDAVRNLVLNDAGFSQVNEASFSKANSSCNYTLSMVIPEALAGQSPLIRDVITKINDSVFGSLYGDSSQNISYSILNATKPELTNIIRDDDIISYSIATTQKIVNKVIVNYRPFVDIYSGNDAKRTYVYISKFVDDLVGIKNTIEQTLYIYDDAKAQIIAQRLALFNSLSNSSINIKASLNLAKTIVNDKIFLSFDRLYGRFAGGDNRKLGSVTGVKKDEFTTELTVIDMGNIYNRVPSIAPSLTSVYTSANDDDKIRWGYILNNDTHTPDEAEESALGSGVIG